MRESPILDANKMAKSEGINRESLVTAESQSFQEQEQSKVKSVGQIEILPLHVEVQEPKKQVAEDIPMKECEQLKTGHKPSKKS